MKYAGFATAVAVALATPVKAENDDAKWDVTAPSLGEAREVSIDVDEGTWMSLDVSPDGRTIAFDLLGDIYTMSINGGEATPIAEGMAWEMQPRFSPDGNKVAFTSDRAGGDNIWIMSPDGSDKRQLTKESFRLLNNPTWSPDGQFIAARKHYTTQRSLGVGEVWLYHIAGGGGVQLVKRPSEAHQKELGEPIFSPDGQYIYYTQNITSGPVFIYAQNSNRDLFNIKRYEIATGEIETAASGPGGSVRAAPSPDGTKLAFVRRERMQSKLYIKDLKTGEERALYHDLDRDLQEIWAIHGLYPNIDWLPNNRDLVFWAGGKIRRINTETGEHAVIPFRVNNTRTVHTAPRPAVGVAPDEFRTKMVKFASVSPDGRQVVFESLGKLYIKPTSGGAAKRLTRQSDDFEFFPSWSRDGKWLAYVSWNDEDLGTIRTVSAGGGTGRAVTREPGHYRWPRFSPDGRTIVYQKARGGGLVSDEHGEASGVYRIALRGGAAVRIAKSGYQPHFGAGNDRVFMSRSSGDTGELFSVNLNGEDERTHASGAMVTAYQVAPSGKALAFRENYNVFVMPMTTGPQKIASGHKASAVPVTRASKWAGAYMNWADDDLYWSMGATLFGAALGDLLPDAPKAEGDDGYSAPETGLDLSMMVASDKPSGLVALTGAKIITMANEDGGVIESGTVLIRNNRIEAVGADIAVPDGARIVDVAGKVIIPGLIDAHAHGPQGIGDLIPQQNWSAMAHLALGVTTVHDPSNTASHFFAASEYQRAGKVLAPRLYSTGEIVYGARNPGFYAIVDSYNDALGHVKRLKSQGAHSIKNYNQPRREQRQQVTAAAMAEGLAVVTEGGSLFHMDMSLIQDGNTSIEHNLPQEHLYEDVLSFFAASDAAYTPTLAVTFGGVNGDAYWRDVTEVWKHPILSKHAPWRALAASSVRRMRAPEEDYFDGIAAREAKKLADRGVPVSIGAHGQQQGLAAHWEMWSFGRGGMSPLEILKTATTTPAAHLGFDADIGSLEAGKLADLVVLNSDPLADIRQSDDIEMVMLNGRLYDADTLNELVTGDHKRSPYWWE